MEQTDPTAPFDHVDLTNCDREPIHLLGGVQAYGCLIATSADFLVSAASRNLTDVLQIDPEAAIGRRLLDLLPSQTVHDLRTKLQLINIDAGVGRLFGYDVLGDGRQFDVSIHQSGPTFVFEFEPKHDTENRNEMSLVQPLINRVSQADSVEAACKQAAVALQILSGFDRVMVYKFSEDDSGEVIAEHCPSEGRQFLGLRFPASDIPAQARALYKRSLLRLIWDVDGAVSPLVPQTGPTGKALDLSMAVTRAVSPIHLEYLRNMGVSASMSVSILKDGELWGLFACHHKEPRYIDYERRTAIEMFSQFFAYELSQKIERALRLEDHISRRLHERLMIRLSGGEDLVDGFDVISEELSELVRNDGIAIFTEGRYVAKGHAPTQDEFLRLARFLNTVPMGEVFATQKLPELMPEAGTWSEPIAGIMAIPISRTPRDYIVFFRREIARSVTWAGNPEKAVQYGPNGARLTPRKSFDAWSQLVRGTSEHWSDPEQRTAEALRLSLIEIVLKLTDDAQEERQRAAAKQDMLIAELNHRVRNILNLIRGLVSQSRDNADDIDSYTRMLDGRIQALARAHDQLTRQQWSPTSLRRLIEVEVNAFMHGQKDRLIITGDAPMIMPDAFSSLALVLHELMTNSAKYGALTDHAGKVTIDLRIDKHRALSIKWRESGGPPVSAPKRRGFGTTVIEKTIPYELAGTVETRYPREGFEADLTIPADAISPLADTFVPGSADSASDAQHAGIRLSGDALVLEDNMIIAMETADTLERHGARKVHLASSVHAALGLIAQHKLEIAVLDVNLGPQTSRTVADELAALGIPFVLATGYGDDGSVLKGFPPTRILSKPFDQKVMMDAVTAVLAEGA